MTGPRSRLHEALRVLAARLRALFRRWPAPKDVREALDEAEDALREDGAR